MEQTLYPALELGFSRYTIERYEKAMTGRVEAEETPGMPGMGETHHGGEWMERRGMMNRGGMMDGGWCW
jgi:hypothetical protein